MDILYSFETSYGTFKIVKNSFDDRFSLFIDDERLGSYISPEQAADDVYMCATGHDEWDNQLTVDYPESLSDWIKH